jgi:hypothetical protein
VTGPEHYREAERLLADAASGSDSGPSYYLDDALPTLAAAQAHATLAAAAATADALVPSSLYQPWQEVSR